MIMIYLLDLFYPLGAGVGSDRPVSAGNFLSLKGSGFFSDVAVDRQGVVYLLDSVAAAVYVAPAR